MVIRLASQQPGLWLSPLFYGVFGHRWQYCFQGSTSRCETRCSGLLRGLAWFVYSDPRLELHMTLFALRGQLLTFGVEDRQRPRRSLSLVTRSSRQPADLTSVRLCRPSRHLAPRFASRSSLLYKRWCHSVRQARERRKRLELGNLSLQPCGLTNPARQSLASSRKRVLRGGGRLPLRSVDSESQCHAIEPRNLCSREPPLLTQAGAAPRRRNGLACIGPTGVLEQGEGHEGRSGT